MRNPADRIGEALSFEIIGLMIVTPLFAGLFDHALNRQCSDMHKTLLVRVAHAVQLGAMLLALLLPLFAWWLSISLQATLVMELLFASFYMVSTFVSVRGYDVLFLPPRPEWAT
jgi:uncharacterized membrane protein